MTKPIRLTLYMRSGCTLCTEAYYMLLLLAEVYPLEIEQIDITRDHELELRYLLEIPVLEMSGEIIAITEVEEQAVRAYIEHALEK